LRVALVKEYWLGAVLQSDRICDSRVQDELSVGVGDPLGDGGSWWEIVGCKVVRSRPKGDAGGRVRTSLKVADIVYSDANRRGEGEANRTIDSPNTKESVGDDRRRLRGDCVDWKQGPDHDKEDRGSFDLFYTHHTEKIAPSPAVSKFLKLTLAHRVIKPF